LTESAAKVKKYVSAFDALDYLRVEGTLREVEIEEQKRTEARVRILM
jgi:hypothetical protein